MRSKICPVQAHRDVLWPSRALDKSIIHPPPSFFLSVCPRRSLRMQPTLSGGMSDNSERAAASRNALRMAAGVLLATRPTFSMAATRAF